MSVGGFRDGFYAAVTAFSTLVLVYGTINLLVAGEWVDALAIGVFAAVLGFFTLKRFRRWRASRPTQVPEEL